MGERIGEQEMEELVPGLRRDKESWFLLYIETVSTGMGDYLWAGIPHNSLYENVFLFLWCHTVTLWCHTVSHSVTKEHLFDAAD